MTSQYGGKVYVTPPIPPFPMDYTNGPNGYGGGYGGGGSVNCSGTITVTFTWVTDDPYNDPPPDNVVVTETCTASWSGYDVVPPTGSCNNGLGFDAVYLGPVPGVPSPPFYSASWSSSGTRYSVHPGEDSPGSRTLTITCNPSAQASSFIFASASVYYTCAVSPVHVTLSGGGGLPYLPHFIIGKGVTATLDQLPLTPTSYNWSVDGGNPFEDYYTIPWGTSMPDSSHYDGLVTTAGSSLHFYFAKWENDQKTAVACSAHLAVPSGAHPAGGLNVTAHRNCIIDKPSNTVSVYMGWVQLTQNPQNVFSLILWGAYYDGDTWGNWWVGAVTTPPVYANPVWPGGWNYTQLWTPNRTPSLWCNGQQGLDTTFGYDPDWPDLYPDNGTVHKTGDAPWETLLPPRTYVSMNDSFTTYTLYRPPGPDTKLVALKNWGWFAAGEATWNGTAWILSNAGAQWGFLEDFPRQPIWTQRDYVP
jgi:hypothetical protein